MAKRAKPDDLSTWGLHCKRENQDIDFKLLDKQASVSKDKFDLAEKQFNLDEKRFALAKEVHQLNKAQQNLANDELKIANDKLKLALDKWKTGLYAKEKALDDKDKTLDEKEKFLDHSEELLRESKYVCGVCLEPVPSGALRALDPCGHCFCATCVLAHGIVPTNEADPMHEYEGTCPTCRGQIQHLLTLFL
jgi:hypothetical protein